MSSIISHIYMADKLKDRYKLKNEFLYGAILPDIKEFLMLSTNNTITSNINKNFKLFDLQCNKFNLLTTDLINEYIEEALSKVILILDEFLYKK